MLLNIHFYGDEEEELVELEIIPAIQADNYTKLVTDREEKDRIFSFIEDISINIEIDEDGIVREVSN